MSEPARHYAQTEPASRVQPGPLRDWLAAMKAATTPAASEAAPETVYTQAPAQKTAPRGAGPPTRAAARVSEPQAEARESEGTGQWIPRVVVPASSSAAAAQGDVSDLMAENIMLKAKLKVENDRYDVLQGVIARELRNLRAHVEEEMQAVDHLRAERDRLVASEAEVQRELGDLRTQVAIRTEDTQREIRDLRNQLAAREEAAQREVRDLRAEIATREEESRREAQELRAQIAADANALTEIRGERDLWAARADALAQPIFQKRNAA